MACSKSSIAYFYFAQWALLYLCVMPLLAQTATLQFSRTDLPAGNGPRAATLIDLDRDGQRDLVVANLRGSNIALLFGDGSGSYVLRDSIATIHKAPHAIAHGDFDEDGVLDVVTANRDSHTVALFLGDGDGGLRPPSFFATGQGPRWIAVTDFDEDGHADLAVTNRDDDNITVLLGSDKGNFVRVGEFDTGDGPVPIAAADFTGNGLVDLAVANDLSDTLVVLAGDGTGAFTRAAALAVGASPKHIAVGDLNRDGLADLAVACLLDGTETLLFADGQGDFALSSYPAGEGSFAPAQTFAIGLAPHALLSGDFDGDGRPVLASSNTGDNTVTILLNLTPPQESVHEVGVIQRLYSDFFPDPLISPAGQPLRLLLTTDSREYVNRLRLLPFIEATDVVRVGEITTIEFVPENTGTYQIQNIGHGFTGDIIVLADQDALPTREVCEGMEAFEIAEGHFGDVRLDGLRGAGLYRWPGPVHEGSGAYQVIVDEKATDEQQEALFKIMSGEEQEPNTMFNIYGSTIDEEFDPIVAKIEFEWDIKARTGRMAVSNVLDASLEPIRNPVTGAPHRALIKLPEGFEYREAEMASSTFWSSGAISLNHKNCYGLLTYATYGPYGIIAEQSHPLAEG